MIKDVSALVPVAAVEHVHAVRATDQANAVALPPVDREARRELSEQIAVALRERTVEMSE